MLPKRSGASAHKLFFMRVAVVGLGYVGLPLAVTFAEAGEDVTAFDISPGLIAQISRGESHIEDIPNDRLSAVLDRIEATDDPGRVGEADAVLICVPTPLNANREPDLSALRSAGEMIASVARSGQLVVLESTTYPGTTRDLLAPLLVERGLTPGEDVSLAFSPERVDPGRTDYTIRNTPKVVGGLTDACTQRARALYELVCDRVVTVSSPEAAELTKLLENIFRSVNIALVNELAMISERMGVDIWEVVDAAATKPFGFMSFEPGPGMGGHCLPVDPFYLAWKARELDLPTEFIEVAGKINQRMPYFCVEQIERMLNDVRKPVRGTRITLLGVSYKAGVGDTRESPALKIIDLLSKRGAELCYHDPYVPELGLLNSLSLQEALADAELVVILTAHPGIDYEGIANTAPLLFDLRGVTRGVSSPTTVRLSGRLPTSLELTQALPG